MWGVVALQIHIEKENKMNRLIINNVKQSLEKRVQGSVKVSIIKGDLIVDIFSHGLAFRFYRRDIGYYIQQDVPISAIVNAIIEEFLWYIKRKFFK